jgi:hypothetical protein
VKDLRRNQAPEALRQTQARHTHSGMSSEQWAAFLLDYKGPVDNDIAGYVRWVDGKIVELKGTAPVPGDPNTPYYPDDTDLSTLSQAVLDAEMARLEKLVSADKETQRGYTALSGSIAKETAALQTLTEKLNDSKGAKDRARELQTQREEAYGRAFDALVAEQSVLEDLYAPLMARLAAASGTLKKLSFSVARVANVEQWASEAEDGLIDLRKAGAFRGKGTLLQKTNEVTQGSVGDRGFGRCHRRNGGVPAALSKGFAGPLPGHAYGSGGISRLVEALRPVAFQHRSYRDPLWHRL